MNVSHSHPVFSIMSHVERGDMPKRKGNSPVAVLLAALVWLWAVPALLVFALVRPHRARAAGLELRDFIARLCNL